MSLPSVLALVPLLLAPRLARDEELERWVRALDSAREPEWTEALERLSALGETAAERVLLDFDRVDFAARRARAKLLVQIPAPEQSARVLVLLDDPDPQVRRLLALLLGNPALAEAAARERVAALERLCREDPSDLVRARAREALAECALAEAVPALDRLIGELPAEEAEKAAAALAQLPAARERLLARVTAASQPDGEELAGGVLAALLRGYGRALAEVPRGGEELRERLPLLRGRTHAAPAVRAAAQFALGTFVARAAELSESERADRVLEALGREGWPVEECLRRRLDLAWLERGEPAAALELARELVRTSQRLPPDLAEAWELHARFLEGAALYALDRSAEAEGLFADLTAQLEASGVRRPDLFPCPRAEDAEEWTEGGGALQVNRLLLVAEAHLWQALLALGAGPRAQAVLAELRAAHLRFLEARRAAMRTGAGDPTMLDELFDRDLSPYSLVLFNDRLGSERRAAGLDRALALGWAWGLVAPIEMLGFAPPDGVDGVLADPVRLEALRALRTAEIEQKIPRLKRRLAEEARVRSDPDMGLFRARVLDQRRRMLSEAENAERALDAGQLAGAYDPGTQLLEYLAASMHTHALAGQLRQEGRTREARELCDRALATLRTSPGPNPVMAEYTSARFELMRGSTFMDEGRAQEAEKACQEAVRRLEAIEAALEEHHPDDPEGERTREGQLRMIREMRGDALLSLAVNANVRMGDPRRALEYFERAYDLNQNPFMRVLRACYRARSGKADEARTVLRSVVPVPSLYYNIACTHALLGEKDEALDYLERDFRENYPTEGARARQREWTRKDPDLASLRGEPRFERLIGGQ